MRTNFLRAKLHLKRRLLTFFGFKPKSYISLYNLEKSTEVEMSFLKIYSAPFVIEGMDKRNSRSQGHYFAERNINIVKDVIVEPKQGILYSKNGKFIVESSTWDQLQQYVSFPWNPRGISRSLDIENAIVLSSNPYGHWLIEDLGPTIAAMQCNRNAPLLVAKNHPKYVSDFLATTKREIHFLSGPTLVKSVLHVEKGNDSGWVHSVDVKTILDYEPFALARRQNSSIKRVYASRVGLKRSPENEDEIAELFRSFGFSIVNLATLNLLDEISLIANTDVLAGVHGSTFVNQIWMKKDSIAFEIVNKNYWTEMDLDQYLGLGIQKEIHSYIGVPTEAVPIEPLELKLKSLFEK
jgi:hypothetical protein